MDDAVDVQQKMKAAINLVHLLWDSGSTEHCQHLLLVAQTEYPGGVREEPCGTLHARYSTRFCGWVERF